MNHRIVRLKEAVQKEKPGVCSERALLFTDYFRNKENRKKTRPIQMAEAIRHVLTHKSIHIYPDELVVGNYTSRRVGGIIYPELHGLGVLLEIFQFHRRPVNPLATTWSQRWRLFFLIPFWLTRNIPYLAFKSPLKKLSFLLGQLTAREYQIYEAGGIAHLAPDYEKLLRMGVKGILEEIDTYRKKETDPVKREFFDALTISAQSLGEYAERYAGAARIMADGESDPEKKAEFEDIADNCQAMRSGAKTFHGAVQAMFLAHTALFQESMGETICPGRLDQTLYPYYQQDLATGKLSREKAKAILSAYCVKLCETVPVFPEILTKTLGGLPSYQVVTIGGVDERGNDAQNAVSDIFLEIMDALRMRQPNFHIRLHDQSPRDFYDRVIQISSETGAAPALYHDEAIIETMTKAGYRLEDARNYVAIGCVEPTAQGKTLGSTDAAIINIPLALELALNGGRRFGSRRRIGAKSMPVSTMTSMADVTAAYQRQLRHQIEKAATELKAIEKAHAVFHPTPFTSMLIDGCLQKGMCATAGGAIYNFSGIQGVGLATVGDSLRGIEQAVFVDKRVTFPELVDQLQKNLADEKLHAYLKRLGKFGNDHQEADGWTRFVVDDYAEAIRALGVNTRGGDYVPGIYSNTTHVHFGSVVGALPSGRRRGEPFESGMAPENGMDKQGPLALIHSMNRLDFTRIPNGINFNMKFDPLSLRDDKGRKALGSMIQVYFSRGGTQIQTNVLDLQTLLEARNNPERYPTLLVRVSGYSAYFNDLSPEMKEEIIARSFNNA